MGVASINEIVKSYILEEILPGENPDALNDTICLLSGGILDSITTLRLVSFIEKQYGIEIEAHEMTVDYFNTLSDMVSLIQSKLSEE